MKKKHLLLNLLVVSMFFLTGCLTKEEHQKIEENRAQIEKDNEVTTNADIPVYITSEDNISFSQQHKVTDEIEVETSYNLDKYDAAHWLITDSKVINMELNAKALPEDTEIFVEYVHADVSIVGQTKEINGLLQDSMDDQFHGNGTDQPGYFVSSTKPYKESFAIEGLSETLISGYSTIFGGRLQESRVTEQDLRSKRAYGSKLQVVYNLAVKYPGEKFYHSETIVDQIIFEIPGRMEEIEADKKEEEERKKESQYLFFGTTFILICMLIVPFYFGVKFS